MWSPCDREAFWIDALKAKENKVETIDCDQKAKAWRLQVTESRKTGRHQLVSWDRTKGAIKHIKREWESELNGSEVMTKLSLISADLSVIHSQGYHGELCGIHKI